MLRIWLRQCYDWMTTVQRLLYSYLRTTEVRKARVFELMNLVRFSYNFLFVLQIGVSAMVHSPATNVGLTWCFLQVLAQTMQIMHQVQVS